MDKTARALTADEFLQIIDDREGQMWTEDNEAICKVLEEYHALRSREDKERIERLEKRNAELERGIECFNNSERNLRNTIHYQITKVESFKKALLDIKTECENPEDDNPSVDYIMEKCLSALSGESKENL